MFKLALGIGFLLLMWLQSLFTQTVCVIDGGARIYRCNWVPWAFLVLVALMLIGFAIFAARVMKERVLAAICLLGIPMFGLLSLSYFYQRVELTDELLVHRREPPHTKFNVDIPWESIQGGTKTKRETPGIFSGSSYVIGYTFRLKDGSLQELPTNELLTSASDEIDRVLAARNIAIETRTIPMPK